MDNLNELGKSLGSNRKKATIGVQKERPIKPQIERARDTVDAKVPFELDFYQPHPGNRVLLSIDFLPPPKVGCCADCSCAVCEFFGTGTTETLFTTTYAYVPGTVVVFKNNIQATNFTETDPALGQVTVWAHNNEGVVICYVYDVCL